MPAFYSKPITFWYYLKALLIERQKGDKPIEDLIKDTGIKSTKAEPQETLLRTCGNLRGILYTGTEKKIEICYSSGNEAPDERIFLDTSKFEHFKQLMNKNAKDSGSAADLSILFDKRENVHISSKNKNQSSCLDCGILEIVQNASHHGLADGEFLISGVVFRTMSKPNKSSKFAGELCDLAWKCQQNELYAHMKKILDFLVEEIKTPDQITLENVFERMKKFENKDKLILFTAEESVTNENKIYNHNKRIISNLIRANQVIRMKRRSNGDTVSDSDTEDSSLQREKDKIIAEKDKEMEKMRIEFEEMRIKMEKMTAERDATPESSTDTKEDKAAMDTTSESSNDISGEFPTDTEEDEEAEAEIKLKTDLEKLRELERNQPHDSVQSAERDALVERIQRELKSVMYSDKCCERAIKFRSNSKINRKYDVIYKTSIPAAKTANELRQVKTEIDAYIQELERELLRKPR